MKAPKKEGFDTIEWQVLVYLSKMGITEESIDISSILEIKSLDWNLLLHLAGLHRIKSLVHQGVMKWQDKHLVPSVVLDQLSKIHRHRSYTNLDHAKEMIQLIGLFAERGVEVIPYKGVILGQEAYGNVSLRDMSDIDLLMELSDFEVIKDVILKRDYVPSKHVPKEFEATFFKQNFEYNFDLYENGNRKYHVEPHWKIGFRRWQTGLNFKDVLPLTEKRPFFGTSVNMLTPEGLLLTTCLHHGGEDRWNSLKYLCDVAAILFKLEKDLDWELLLAESDKFKVTNIVLLGIGAAKNIFDAPVPQNIASLLSSRKLKYHIQKVDDQLKSSARSANVNAYLNDIGFHFSLRKNWSTKFKVLYYHITQLFVPTIYDVNHEDSIGKKYWWLVVTRPFRIWRTHIKPKSKD